MGGKFKRTRAAGEPLRTDARRNRQKLLDAAVSAFAKDPGASIDGIAKKAGVGIGTLYRHYPTRQALLEAAYRNEIRTLCEEAPALLERHRPDVALAEFLDRFIEYMSAKRGMIEAMRAVVQTTGVGSLSESFALLTAAVEPMIEAGRAEGLLRDDVTLEDFLVLKGAVVNVAPRFAKRLAVLLFDGLRYRAPGSDR